MSVAGALWAVTIAAGLGLAVCLLMAWLAGPDPAGRHRHPTAARATRQRDVRGPLFPRPTRAQLRDEALR